MDAPKSTSPKKQPTFKLPEINTLSPLASLGWLRGGLQDLQKAHIPCLIYGFCIATISASIIYALAASGHSDWVMVLMGGFFIIAPMLAMGIYEAGRLIEAGERPTIIQIAFVRGAVRQDVAYLGLALLLVYFFWGRMAQLIYALSTYRKHNSVHEFLTFMTSTAEGHSMALIGTIVGGIIAFIAFSLVVMSAPMLLDRKTDVFVAIATSVRAVNKNPIPMFIWALIISLLIGIGILTACIGLIFIFPVIGLASWRAYKDVVLPPTK